MKYLAQALHQWAWLVLLCHPLQRNKVRQPVPLGEQNITRNSYIDKWINDFFSRLLNPDTMLILIFPKWFITRKRRKLLRIQQTSKGRPCTILCWNIMHERQRKTYNKKLSSGAIRILLYQLDSHEQINMFSMNFEGWSLTESTIIKNSLPTETDDIRTPSCTPTPAPFFHKPDTSEKTHVYGMHCSKQFTSSNMDSTSGSFSFGLDVTSCQFFWPVNWILMNKIRKEQYLQRSHINLNWFSCGSSILVELEFEMLVLVEGGKPESNFPSNPRHSWLNFPWDFKPQKRSHFYIK